MTETTQHPVDLALRTLAIQIDPSPADFDYSWVKLMDAVSAASRPPARTSAPLSWAMALGIVLVVAVLVVQTVTSPPAEALLTELALVVEARDPLAIADGQFAYTKTVATGMAYIGPDAMGDVQIPHSELAYHLPKTQEIWVGNEGTIHMSETNLVPEFFSPADETAYYEAEVDKRDMIGKVQIRNQTEVNLILDERDWPENPVALEITIRSVIGDTDQDVLETCLKMLRASLISDDLRIGVLRVIAGLDLDLVDDGSGGGTFSVEFETPSPMRLTFTLDDAGYLRFEERILVEGSPELGVPPGTVDYSATYSVPVLVDGFNLP